MLGAEGVEKRFGRVSVLKKASFELHEGEIVALIGPNGAGKTTLLKILATQLRPTSGRVTIDGNDAFDDLQLTRRKIGVVAHQPYTYDHLTVEENLVYYGRMFGMSKPESRERAIALEERLGLGLRRNDASMILSQGMRQRLSIARALMHGPSLLLLDEPFSNLDSAATRVLGDLLLDLRKDGKGVLIITHDLARLPGLADRALIMVDGRVCESVDLKAAGCDLAASYSCAIGEAKK